MEVKITKNIDIAFDGINIKSFKKGDVIAVTPNELERLKHYDACEDACVGEVTEKLKNPKLKKKTKTASKPNEKRVEDESESK